MGDPVGGAGFRVCAWAAEYSFPSTQTFLSSIGSWIMSAPDCVMIRFAHPPYCKARRRLSHSHGVSLQPGRAAPQTAPHAYPAAPHRRRATTMRRIASSLPRISVPRSAIHADALGRGRKDGSGRAGRPYGRGGADGKIIAIGTSGQTDGAHKDGSGRTGLPAPEVGNNIRCMGEDKDITRLRVVAEVFNHFEIAPTSQNKNLAI